MVTNDLDGIEDYLPPPQRFVVGLPPLAELHEVGMKRRRASRMMLMQQGANSIEKKNRFEFWLEILYTDNQFKNG